MNAKKQAENSNYLKNEKRQIPIDPRILKFKFPEVREKLLSNGLRLLIVERPEVPKVYLRIGLACGNKNDPPEKVGLAQLLAATIKKGTTRFDSYRLVDEIERIGGELDAVVNEDFFFVYGEFLNDSAETGIRLLQDILLNPVFQAQEVEKERYRLLADIENENSSPQFLANRRMDKALFGSHPYGYYKNRESLLNIDRNDLVNQHEKFFGPAHSVMVIAGAISEDRAIELGEKYFSEWKPKKSFPLSAEIPEAGNKPLVYLIDRPGSEQSNILLGNLLFPRNHPDYVSMLVMNKILGGGGSGRLFMHLREEKGLTYGAYSTINAYLENGSWLARAEVRTPATAEAIEAFFDEFRKIKQEQVSKEDLQNAIRYLVGFFPLQNETPSSIAALALKQKLFDLPKNYWNSFIESIGQVTQDAVQKMAQKYIREDRMAIVVVGDSTKILKELNIFGEVQQFDVNDIRI